MSRFPDAETFEAHLDRLGFFHMDLSLDRMRLVLRALDLERPPYRVVQVVGTNGKGSTATFLESVLRARGLRTGLYTSPHFVTPTERVRVNGARTDMKDWLESADACLDVCPDLTYFELLTCVALDVFRRRGVDVAVLEAGLGARYDATTATAADTVVFTPIGLDHTALLGRNVAAIAWEKGHAIRSDAPVFSAVQPEEAEAELERRARSFGAPFHVVGDLPFPLHGRLLGSHQSRNAALALEAAGSVLASLGMKADPEADRAGLARAWIPGRLQIVSPVGTDDTGGRPPRPGCVLDGAHNPHGTGVLVEALRTLPELTGHVRSVVFSCFADKDWRASLGLLTSALPDADYHVVELEGERAEKKETVAGEIRRLLAGRGGSRAHPVALHDSLEECMAALSPGKPGDLVLVTGSLYLLSAFYTLWPEELDEPGLSAPKRDDRAPDAKAPLTDEKKRVRPPYAALPSTAACLEQLPKALEEHPEAHFSRVLAQAPRPLVTDAVRAWVDTLRRGIAEGSLPDADAVRAAHEGVRMAEFCAAFCEPRLLPVLNGTGVVVHTNTGRSVLAPEAAEAMERAALGYTSLELDMETGGRGHRDAILSGLLARLTGAEDGLVVNNNAAAVLLVMDTFCRGHEAVISRGELVEIGGSFRIPAVMEATGVRLREVGTTNRTHARDYVAAVGEETRAIVRVHRSNFRIVGFEKSVPTQELAKIAREHNLLLVNDLGSGSLVDFQSAGLTGEPTVQEAVSQGSDLVLFSGDKLLGGPQAGLVVGRADLIARLRRNPLLRALRCGKLIYAALEATLRLYLDPERARESVPTVRDILLDETVLAARATELAALVRDAVNTLCPGACGVELQEDGSRTGGGAFPEVPLPTTLVTLRPTRLGAEELRERLLKLRPVLIGRVERDRFCLDPRTLPKDDFQLVADLLARALKGDGNARP